MSRGVAAPPLPRRAVSFALLGVVAVSWGLSWPAIKAVLDYMPPIWAVAARSGVATVMLALISAPLGRLRAPPRQDLPVVVSVGVLHMVIFTVLCSIGLMHVTAGRSVLLAYTAPLWVFPIARVALAEAVTPRRLIALACGLAGLAVLLNPLSIDWTDAGTLTGHGLILLAAVSWSFSIVYTRAHRWASPPFDLLFWQILLATALTLALALIVEGVPRVQPDIRLLLLLAFAGGIGTGLAYWALNTANRALPATTTALGLLGVPVLGVICSMLTLGEPVDFTALAAMALIVGGIGVGVTGDSAKAAR